MIKPDLYITLNDINKVVSIDKSNDNIKIILPEPIVRTKYQWFSLIKKIGFINFINPFRFGNEKNNKYEKMRRKWTK